MLTNLAFRAGGSTFWKNVKSCFELVSSFVSFCIYEEIAVFWVLSSGVNHSRVVSVKKYKRAARTYSRACSRTALGRASSSFSTIFRADPIYIPLSIFELILNLSSPWYMLSICMCTIYIQKFTKCIHGLHSVYMYRLLRWSSFISLSPLKPHTPSNRDRSTVNLFIGAFRNFSRKHDFPWC